MSELFSGALRRRSLLILATWLFVSAAYYGVFVWLPSRLVTEGYGFVRGYGFLVLLALAQVPGYALAAVGLETIGRRLTLILFLVASAAGCLTFIVAGHPLLIAAALLAMSFALLGTWGALYAYTPELYPTELRATGMGMAGAMARFGGLLAPPRSPWSSAPASRRRSGCSRCCCWWRRWRSAGSTWKRGDGRWNREHRHDRFRREGIQSELQHRPRHPVAAGH